MLYARPFTAGFDPGAFVGAAGALVGGLVVICIKRLANGIDPRHHVLLCVLEHAAGGGADGAVVGDAELDRVAFLALIGLLGISGQALITHGLSQGEATVLVPLDYSRILYSAIVGYLVFGEMPGPWSFAGMAIIVACSLYLVLTERRR